MDRWKYFDVTHRDHLICNPTSAAKLDELIELLDLPSGGRVLDIACGKGEPLIRIVERYGVRAVGVDLSPHHLGDARKRVAARLPGAGVELLEMDGASYTGEPGSFDLAMCLGASWIWNGYRGTLRALSRFVRPGSLVLSGEPYWKREPDPEYLASDNLTREMFADHAGNVAIGVEEGLAPLYTMVSSDDEWDRYEALQWRAAERYAVSHAEDPDAPAIRDRCRAYRDAYLRWGRDTLGWAMYLFQR
jgi:SAM-dependent methyltransferase